MIQYPIIHYIKFSHFLWGRTNSWKLHVVKMDIGDSHHSSSAKIKLYIDTFSSCGETCVSRSSSIWTSKVGKIVKQLYYFLWTEKVRNTSSSCIISRCEWWTHWVYHTSGDHISKCTGLRVDWCLSWMNKWPNFIPPKLHNHSSNLQVKKSGMIPWICRFPKHENYM